jgi:hypothetical protein
MVVAEAARVVVVAARVVVAAAEALSRAKADPAAGRPAHAIRSDRRLQRRPRAASRAVFESPARLAPAV